VMAALDHVDRIDLHIAEVSYCIRSASAALPTRVARVEPLGAQPDLPGLCRRERKGFWCAGHCERQCSGIRARKKNRGRTTAKKSRAAICCQRGPVTPDWREAYFIAIAFSAFT